MKFKPIRFIPDDTRFPIMRLSRFGFFVSGLLSLASVLLFVFVGLNVGVDFKGGTVMTIRTADAANIEQLREQLMQQAVDQMSGAMADMSPEDMARMKDMLGELNQMLADRAALARRRSTCGKSPCPAV